MKIKLTVFSLGLLLVNIDKVGSVWFGTSLVNIDKVDSVWFGTSFSEHR